MALYFLNCIFSWVIAFLACFLFIYKRPYIMRGLDETSITIMDVMFIFSFGNGLLSSLLWLSYV